MRFQRLKSKFDKFKWLREFNFYENLNGAFILIPRSNLISSTGLDASSPTQGFKQKQGKRPFHSFLREDKRRERVEGEARFSRHLAEEISSEHEYRGDFIVAQIPMSVRLHLLQAHNLRKVQIMYSTFLGMVSQEKSGIDFEDDLCHIYQDSRQFCGIVFKVVRLHLMQSIQYSM